jgi:ankyrin repeat protein
MKYVIIVASALVLVNCTPKKSVKTHTSPVPLVYAPAQHMGRAPNTADEQKLFAAIKNNDLATLRAVVESGVNINCLSQDEGRTPIILAILDNRIDAVKYLLNMGADPAISDNWGNAICSAALYHRPEIMQLLMDSGADPNTKTKDGTPVLLFAVSENHVETVKVLIAAGADVNAVSRQGETPLTSAKANETIRALLVTAGAK